MFLICPFTLINLFVLLLAGNENCASVWSFSYADSTTNDTSFNQSEPETLR